MDPPSTAAAPELGGAGSRGFPPELERAFRRHWVERSCMRIRAGMAAGLLLFAGLALQERLTLPAELARHTVPIRLLVVGPLFAATLLASFSATLRRRLALLLVPTGLACGLSTAAILALARMNGAPANDAGLFLVTLGIYSLSGLRTPIAALCCVSFLAVHLAMQAGIGTPATTLVGSGLFLAAANALGALEGHGRERAGRLDFLLLRRLHDLSERDALTGLWNRRAFDLHLQRALAQATRDARPLALLLLDVDYFERFNAAYGREAGDRCLARVGTAIAAAARRPLDLAARVEGAAFALVAYDTGQEGAEVLAHRVHELIGVDPVPHAHSAVATRVTVSIGAVVGVPLPETRPEDALALAEAALHDAKTRGRNGTGTCELVAGAGIEPEPRKRLRSAQPPA